MKEKDLNNSKNINPVKTENINNDDTLEHFVFNDLSKIPKCSDCGEQKTDGIGWQFNKSPNKEPDHLCYDCALKFQNTINNLCLQMTHKRVDRMLQSPQQKAIYNALRAFIEMPKCDSQEELEKAMNSIETEQDK